MALTHATVGHFCRPGPHAAFVLFIVLLMMGCGGNDVSERGDAALDDTRSTTEDVATAPQEGPAAGDNAPLSSADIDRWQRGMAAELEAVQQAEAAFRQAESAEDTLNAMTAANETATLAAGAQAAGVNVERYRFIRRNLSSAVKNLVPLEQEMDISQMPQDMIDQFEQGRQASLDQMSAALPSDVLEALRPRAEELRAQDVALTQARMRAAGIGR